MDARTRKILNLRQGRPDWYSIKAQANGASTEVMIFDEIGYFGVTAQDFIHDLQGISGDIELHLNTPGGEVFDGLAIYNYLSQREGVSVVVDSLAASIGSVIAMAADKGQLVMAKTATLMIHDGYGMTIGNAAEMREMADLLDKASDNIASVYSDRTGRPVSEMRDLMRSETWMSAAEAVDARFADQIQGAKSASNKWDLSIFRNANAGWQQRDGKWVFDPDNDGDNDATASGDTDHDYWSADGKQLKAIPPDPDGKQGKPLPPANQLSGIANWPVEDQTDDSSEYDSELFKDALRKAFA